MSNFPIISPAGEWGTIPQENLASARAAGFRIPNQMEIRDHYKQWRKEDVAATAAQSPGTAAALGGLRGATLGISDWLLSDTEEDAEHLRAVRDANPWISAGSEIGGGIVSAVAGGAGLGALAGKAAATNVGSKVAASAVGKAVAKAAGNRAVKFGMGSAAAGLAYGAGQALSEDALGETELTAESLMGAMGTGAVLGVAGGGVGLALRGVGKLALKGGKLAARAPFAAVAIARGLRHIGGGKAPKRLPTAAAPAPQVIIQGPPPAAPAKAPAVFEGLPPRAPVAAAAPAAPKGPEGMSITDELIADVDLATKVSGRWGTIKGEVARDAPDLRVTPGTAAAKRVVATAAPKESEILFHTTGVDAMEGIAEGGLSPEHGGSLFAHGVYGAHGKGKVFLAEGYDAAREWSHKVEDMLFDTFDDEWAHRPVMLRVKHRHTVADDVGSRDIPGSRYTRERIDPADIEYFDPKRGWSPVSEWDEAAHDDYVSAPFESLLPRNAEQATVLSHAAVEAEARLSKQTPADYGQELLDWLERKKGIVTRHAEDTGQDTTLAQTELAARNVKELADGQGDFAKSIVDLSQEVGVQSHMRKGEADYLRKYDLVEGIKGLADDAKGAAPTAARGKGQFDLPPVEGPRKRVLPRAKFADEPSPTRKPPGPIGTSILNEQKKQRRALGEESGWGPDIGREAAEREINRNIDEARNHAILTLEQQKAKVDAKVVDAVKRLVTHPAPVKPAPTFPKAPAAKGKGKTKPKAKPTRPRARPAAVTAVEMYSHTQEDLRDSALNMHALAENQEVLATHLAEQLAPLSSVAPRIAEHIAVTTTNAVGFLADKAPRPPPETFETREQEWIPPSHKLSAFGRYARAVQRPLSVLDDLAANRVSREGVEALQAVYPALYADVKGQVLAELARGGKAMPFSSRAQISIFLGMPIAALMANANVAKLQQPSDAGSPKKTTKAPRISDMAASNTGRIQSGQ